MSGATVAHYLDLMVDLLLVRRLAPRLANAGKRLVRSPKVYVRDSGLVRALLGLGARRDSEKSPEERLEQTLRLSRFVSELRQGLPGDVSTLPRHDDPQPPVHKCCGAYALDSATREMADTKSIYFRHQTIEKI